MHRHQLHGAVVVAVVAVHMVQPPVHQIVHVVAVGHPLVAAVVAVGATAGGGLAGCRVGRRDLDAALVPVALVFVVQMALVHIVNMVPVADLGVAAGDAVPVRMLPVGVVHGAIPHSLRRSRLLCTFPARACAGGGVGPLRQGPAPFRWKKKGKELKPAVLARAVAENCFEVAPGLYHILLPYPSYVPFVNAWLIHSRSEWALIDCGPNWEPSLRALGRALKAAGVPGGGLKHLLLTHHHTDHAGGSGPVQERWGGQVWMAPAEQAHQPRAPEQVQAWLQRHGVAGDLLAQAGARRRLATDRLPPRLEPLTAGQELAVGDRRLEVIPAPGHTPGQVLLREPGEGWLFSADHLYPAPSWNVWLEAWAPGAPLRQYLQELERTALLRCRLVLPGHGLPFAGDRLPTACAAQARLHRKRADRLLALLGEEELTAHALAGREAPAAAADPAGVGRCMAEILAMLTYLEAMGAVVWREHDGLVRWRARVGAG